MVKLIDAPPELFERFFNIEKAKNNDDRDLGFVSDEMEDMGFEDAGWWDKWSAGSWADFFAVFDGLQQKRHHFIKLSGKDGQDWTWTFIFLGTIPLLKKALTKLERELKLEAFK